MATRAFLEQFNPVVEQGPVAAEFVDGKAPEQRAFVCQQTDASDDRT